jgi:hypothetical protein
LEEENPRDRVENLPFGVMRERNQPQDDLIEADQGLTRINRFEVRFHKYALVHGC